MSEEQTTAGTPNQEGADAAATQTGGTPGTDGRDANAIEGTGITREQALAWKAQAEEANRLRRQLEETNSRQQPAARSDEVDPSVYVNKSREFAQQGDPVAGLGMMNSEQIAAMRAEMAILSLPESERQSVIDHIKANPGRFRDVNQARENLQHGSLSQENVKLKQRIAALEKEPPTGVRTDTVEVTASQHKAREMTLAQFDAEEKRLLAEGDIEAVNKLGLDFRKSMLAGKVKS